MKVPTFKLLVAGLLTTALGWGCTAVIGQEVTKNKVDPTALIKLKLSAARLPSDVQQKTNKILAEHSAKIADAEAKRDAVLTPKQLQGLKQVAAEGARAVKDGTKSPQSAAADSQTAMRALNLTDEQKTQYAAGNRGVATAHENLNEALRGVLSAEHQAGVGIPKKK